jgi:Na+-driven multidrug efflux pump
VLLAYMVSGRSLVTLRLRGVPLRAAAFWEILRVGIPGVANTLLTNVYIMVMTGLAGTFGAAALAGYGLGARLEYLLIPLVFGLGGALVPMVGTNVGAGQHARALRIAWVGAGLASAVTGTIGLVGALAPHLWLGLFTADSDILAAGAIYLRQVGPMYVFFGLGLSLYFSSQGAGRLTWPLVGGVLRLAVAAGGGWVTIHWLGAGLPGMFTATAVALALYGIIVGAAILLGAWGRPARP